MRTELATCGSSRSLCLAAASLVAVLLLFLSCQPAGDPVQEPLNAMTAAAERRDVDAVMERLTEGFQSADGSGRTEAQSTLRRFFAAYEELDVSLSDVSIERSEGAALARFRANLSGKPRQIGGLEGFFPSSSAYRFELRLVPEGSGWKIAWASWAPADGDR